jgi:hypothetical protein
MKLQLVNVELSEANEFVRQLHRHHRPVVGYKFSLGAVRENVLAGVVIIERPVARMRDGGLTAGGHSFMHRRQQERMQLSLWRSSSFMAQQLELRLPSVTNGSALTFSQQSRAHH